MSAPKLTEAQRAALVAYNETPFPFGSRFPKRVGASVGALERKGLIRRRLPLGSGWELTDAGRAALKEGGR